MLLKWIGPLALLAVLVVGDQVRINRPGHKYRLTIEVETPDGLKTGPSLIEPYFVAQPMILTTNIGHWSLRGDAPFVDLGHGKKVVALNPRGPTAGDVDTPVLLAIKAFGVRPCGDFCQWKKISEMSGTRDLPSALLPTLVTVSDVNDLKSVRAIRPDEFEAVFGPGYRFRCAQIELTNDPITRGIKKKIPFLVADRNELTRFRVMRAGVGYVPQLGDFAAAGN